MKRRKSKHFEESVKSLRLVIAFGVQMERTAAAENRFVLATMARGLVAMAERALAAVYAMGER